MDDWDDHPEPAPEPTTTDRDLDGDGAEEAVRRYLTWIADPTSLRDDDRIAELRARIDAATDPIDKIHLASDLHRAQQVDGAELRQRFVAVARRWASTQGIVPEAFLELGVPAEDLRHAGFEVSTPTRRRSEVSTVGASTPRAARTSTDDIRAGARSFEEPFTIADLRDRVGGSPATVRKALESMVAAGEVQSLGAAEGWGGPGRPPHRYRVVR